MHSHRTQQGIANSHSYSTTSYSNTSHSTTSHCQQVINTSHIHMPAHLARADDDSVGGTWMDDDGGAVPGVGLVLLLPFSILPLLLLSPSPPSPFAPPLLHCSLSLPSLLRQLVWGVGRVGGGRTSER
jgi:hypothetical protein